MPASEQLDRANGFIRNGQAPQAALQVDKTQGAQDFAGVQAVGLGQGLAARQHVQARRQFAKDLCHQIDDLQFADVLVGLLARSAISLRPRAARHKCGLKRKFNAMQLILGKDQFMGNALDQRRRGNRAIWDVDAHSLPTTRSMAALRVTVVKGFFTRLLAPSSCARRKTSGPGVPVIRMKPIFWVDLF